MQEYTSRKLPPDISKAEESGSAARAPGVTRSALTSAIQNEINGFRSQRIDLPSVMAQRMNERFGVSMDGIKVFRDDGLKELGSPGYARGNEIHIAENQSASNESLMMHEATHVFQQGIGMVHGSGVIIDSSLERQADMPSFAGDYGGGFSMPASGEGPIQGAAFSNLLSKLSTLPVIGKLLRKMGLSHQEPGTADDRGHDLIMMDAVRDANTHIARERAYTQGRLNNLENGNYENDMAMGVDRNQVTNPDYTYTPGSTNVGILNSIKFALRFQSAEERAGKGINSSDFVQNSHFGNLQFLHNMTSANDDGILDSRDKAEKYFRFAYGISANESVGKNSVDDQNVLNLDSQVGDLVGTRFENLGFQDINDLHTGDMKKAMKARDDAELKYKQSGDMSDLVKQTIAEAKLSGMKKFAQGDFND